MAIRDNPLFTDTYSDLSDFAPEEGSTYIFGASAEERSSHYKDWESKVTNIKFVNIIEQQPTFFIAEENGIATTTVFLRANDQIKSFLESIQSKVLYLDITGLSHHIWAPLLKMALKIGCQEVLGLYVEPEQYRFHQAPKEGEIFDLSEKITGIAPIPGFIRLGEPSDEEKVCFVPLLGFEGTRLAYLIEMVQPPGGKIMPIIGVPGFRAEYPFYTYHGNQQPLLRTQAWRNVQYAVANCPFSAFYSLEKIASKNAGNLLKIAPIGTKPHALGGVLYAIINQNFTELVYDHPIRKPKRTAGKSRLLVYHISAFTNQVS